LPAEIYKKMEKQIEHEGTVASICGNAMVVRIVASPACAGCAAKSRCMPSENQYRDIHVENFSGNFVSGERVKIVMQQSLGFRALCVGYLLPFVVTLTTLLVVYQITKNEFASGLSALLSLIPYFIIIKLLNQKITKTFGFTVKKIDVE